MKTNNKIKVHLIVGARPNFMKMDPLQKEFLKHKDIFDIKLIHTGQHYDEKMSKLFFDDLEMSEPDVYFGVGAGNHAQQTASVMCKYDEYIETNKADHVIVCGDVNSTLACTLVAAKRNIRVSHVEAGLRSFDKTMPEETNRLVTDVLSDMLFIPSEDARVNLLNEGLSENKIYFVGNIMIDSLTKHKHKAEKSNILNVLKLEHNDMIDDYALVTLHRPSNVDSYDGLLTLFSAFLEISKKVKLIFPVHPRTLKNIKNFGLNKYVEEIEGLILIDPVGYLDFMKLQMNAKFILTDSGGIQEESTYFNIPCLTLRENTERPITISLGSNQLVKLTTEDIVQKSMEIVSGNKKSGTIPPLWDGRTAERIVASIISESPGDVLL